MAQPAAAASQTAMLTMTARIMRRPCGSLHRSPATEKRPSRRIATRILTFRPVMHAFGKDLAASLTDIRAELPHPAERSVHHCSAIIYPMADAPSLLTRTNSTIAATLILLSPALWNGFPLLQYDTGGYLARWFEGYLVPSRLGRLRPVRRRRLAARLLAGGDPAGRRDDLDRRAGAAPTGSALAPACCSGSS